MASCGYHSPQFSEDVAWLPPWLQPHQLPIFGDRGKDDHSVSQLSCKNQASLQKNICDGQHGHLFTNGDGKYSSCHLYLSGEGTSQSGNTSSSANASHFCLHLSSVGVSQFSSGQLNDFPQPGNHDTIMCSSKKPFHEIPAVQYGTVSQYKMEGGCPALESPICCKPKMSHRRIITEPLVKSDQSSQQRLQGKTGAEDLSDADMYDAVELSIAASEAMVISEMVSSSLQSNHVPAEAILEIALRVKHERNRCSSDILEADSTFSADELDETDQLSDLDENTMADAYDDAGVSSTQVVEIPDYSYCNKKFLQSNSSFDINTNISANQYGHEEVPKSEKLTTNEDANGTTSRTYGAFVIKSLPKNLPVELPPLKKMKPSAYAPLDCLKPCLKSQSKADKQKFQQNTSALTEIQLGLKEDQRFLEDDRVVTLRDAMTRKSFKVFNKETSFISESMDVMGESTPEHRPEAEPEIVASSSPRFRNLSGSPYKNCERSTKGLAFSQDLVLCCSLSSVDPLCSIVPCSISSEDATVARDPDQKETKEDAEKFMDFAGATMLTKLNEDSIKPNAQEMPSNPLSQGREPVLPKNGVEDSDMPRRERLNSLKPYSMVMPGLNIPEQIVFNSKLIPSQGKDPNYSPFSHPGRNTNCFVSNIDDAEGCLMSTDKCMDVIGPENCPIHESKDHEAAEGTSAIRETKHEVIERTAIEETNHEVIDKPTIKETNHEEYERHDIGKTKNDDVEAIIYHHEERCSPIILNNKKRRFRACRVTIHSEDEESLKLSSASKMRKYKTENSRNEVRCQDPNFPSCFPLQSTLRSHPAEKQRLEKKRVRFLEPKYGVDRIKSGRRLQTKHQTPRAHHRTSNRVNPSTLQRKSISGKESCNYFTCCQAVDEKRMIFQGLEFLLTGFSSQKEKELEVLIRLCGGYILSNIPTCFPELRRKQSAGLASWKMPIVLSPKKVQTAKFLYGCAINTLILDANWLVDSIQADSILPPDKYMIRPIPDSQRNQLRTGEPICFNNCTFIFERFGVMIFGKVSFCTRFSKIIKHGGGHVYKSLQRLVQSLQNGRNAVGAVLVESEGSVSRHLKHCALESNLQMMPASWIVNSLFCGKLLPLKKDRYAPLHRIKMPTFPQVRDEDMSEEI